MELYKYAKIGHAQGTLSRGTVRIGTLYDFRNQEKHGGLVGDIQEGQFTLAGMVEEYNDKNRHEFPALNEVFGIGAGATINGLKINIQPTSLNHYLFSASSGFSPKALRKWYEDPDARYNACYRILSAEAFFQAISRAISDRATPMGYGNVHYYDSDKPIDPRSPLGALPPSQLKGGKIYDDQCEVRARWSPIGPNAPVPFTIDVPEVKGFCVLHATISE